MNVTPRRSVLALLLPLLLVAPIGCASSGGAGGPEGGPDADRPRPGPRGGEPSRELSDAERAALRVAELRVSPDTLQLQVGERGSFEVTAVDSAGETVEGVEVAYAVRGEPASWDEEAGEVEAVRPGDATFYAFVRRPPARPGGESENVVERGTVSVSPLPVARVEVTAPEGPVYAGTRARIDVRVFSEQRERTEADVAWSSSDESVATVSARGLLQARSPGTTTVTADAEGVSASTEMTVVENPVRSVEIEAPERSVVVGRPMELSAVARDAAGEAVGDVAVEWTVAGPRGGMTEAAYVDDDGWFVAENPGLFLATATVGSRSATVELAAEAGPHRRPMEVVGHGPVPGRTTSDLWVFEGVDGRDYAYTGTHAAGAGGNVMFAWDVTDPSDPTITDSVVVDARVVNDVKINETREIAVITREGASDRRNGIVVLDIRTPAHPRILARHTEDLTAGVHNVWIEGDLVYAVNNGTRALHVIDLSDPSAPRQVGRWNLEREGRYLHDVTVEDGLAYLSYWDDGLVILDVGRGIAGGTATEPALVSQFSYRGRFGAETYGNTHHAVPMGDYVFVGDEIFGCSECVNGPRGYVHVIDVSDIEDPKEVAWYRVPEAGTHNLWVEDEKLYVAYYQGGLRVVDVSGELRGDLYRQGREIGWFMPGSSSSPGGDDGDPGAFRPNATMAWGPQPYRGLIFFSDMNSGLWIVDFADEDDDGDGYDRE